MRYVHANVNKKLIIVVAKIMHNSLIAIHMDWEQLYYPKQCELCILYKKETNIIRPLFFVKMSLSKNIMWCMCTQMHVCILSHVVVRSKGMMTFHSISFSTLTVEKTYFKCTVCYQHEINVTLITLMIIETFLTMPFQFWYSPITANALESMQFTSLYQKWGGNYLILNRHTCYLKDMRPGRQDNDMPSVIVRE